MRLTLSSLRMSFNTRRRLERNRSPVRGPIPIHTSVRNRRHYIEFRDIIKGAVGDDTPAPTLPPTHENPLTPQELKHEAKQIRTTRPRARLPRIKPMPEHNITHFGKGYEPTKWERIKQAGSIISHPAEAARELPGVAKTAVIQGTKTALGITPEQQEKARVKMAEEKAQRVANKEFYDKIYQKELREQQAAQSYARAMALAQRSIEGSNKNSISSLANKIQKANTTYGASQAPAKVIGTSVQPTGREVHENLFGSAPAARRGGEAPRYVTPSDDFYFGKPVKASTPGADFYYGAPSKARLPSDEFYYGSRRTKNSDRLFLRKPRR